MTRNLSGLPVAGAFAVVLVLAGCGTADPTAEPTGGQHSVATRVRVVSQTMSGVRREKTATPLPSRQSVASYAAGLGPLGQKVTAAAATLKPASGETLYAQVVYVGCHPAPPATVSAGRHAGRVVLSSDFSEERMTECFAAVVSLALAVVRG